MSKTETPKNSIENRDLPAEQDHKRDTKPLLDSFIKLRTGIKAGILPAMLNQ